MGQVIDIYGKDKVMKQRRMAAKMKYAVLKPSQFDDHEVIARIESVPTFKRDSRFNDELQKLSDNDNDNNRSRDEEESSAATISFT